MSDPKCPFCGEPRTRQCTTYDVFLCGTEGPDINGEYDTGRICDMHVYRRMLNASAKEISTLTARLAAAEAERDENYRLWKEACRVKDIRHRRTKSMTMPHLMNCPHSDDSWCLDCVKQEWDRTDADLARLRGLLREFTNPLSLAWLLEERVRIIVREDTFTRAKSAALEEKP